MRAALEHPCLVKGLGYILPEKPGEPAYALMEFVGGGAFNHSTLEGTGRVLVLMWIARGIERSREEHCAPVTSNRRTFLSRPLGWGSWRLWISALRGVGTDADESSCDCALPSPELLNGEASSEKSDAYSLALLAFELETGKPVFSPKTPFIRPGMDIQSDRQPASPSGMHAM
jgi:hypothetical protein